MFFMAVVNYQTQCRHRHRRIKENFESSNVIYCCHKKAVEFTMYYRRASGADPGLADLQLAVEEQEEVVGQCAAEAGAKRFPFHLVLRKLLG